MATRSSFSLPIAVTATARVALVPGFTKEVISTVPLGHVVVPTFCVLISISASVLMRWKSRQILRPAHSLGISNSRSYHPRVRFSIYVRVGSLSERYFIPLHNGGRPTSPGNCALPQTSCESQEPGTRIAAQSPSGRLVSPIKG